MNDRECVDILDTDHHLIEKGLDVRRSQVLR